MVQICLGYNMTDNGSIKRSGIKLFCILIQIENNIFIKPMAAQHINEVIIIFSTKDITFTVVISCGACDTSGIFQDSSRFCGSQISKLKDWEQLLLYSFHVFFTVLFVHVCHI